MQLVTKSSPFCIDNHTHPAVNCVLVIFFFISLSLLFDFVFIGALSEPHVHTYKLVENDCGWTHQSFQLSKANFI